MTRLKSTCWNWRNALALERCNVLLKGQTSLFGLYGRFVRDMQPAPGLSVETSVPNFVPTPELAEASTSGASPA
jgi:hypothetical protein